MSGPAMRLALFLSFVLGAAGQGIPEELHGRWIVERVLPTTTISCWGMDEANQLIGTVIEYSADSFRWRDSIVANPDVSVLTVSAEQFERENSGLGRTGSKVNFRQLGIQAPAVRQVVIGHPAADITGSTIEIPGDKVLLKNRDTIIFSACNVYFEAGRARQ